MQLALPTDVLKQAPEVVKQAPDTIRHLVEEARDLIDDLPVTVPGLTRPKPRRGRRVVLVGLVAIGAGVAWWAWQRTHLVDDVEQDDATRERADDQGDDPSADTVRPIAV